MPAMLLIITNFHRSPLQLLRFASMFLRCRMGLSLAGPCKVSGCGLPVVSTRHSGIDELVTDGMSGLPAPEKDVSAIAEKLLYLLDNPHSLDDLARTARQCVERKFSIDILNKTLEKIYQDMIRPRS